MKITTQAWNRFLESFDTESDVKNFKYPFGKMTKTYGGCYIFYCQELWKANDGVQTEEEFMEMNGGMPKSFFDKVINK